MKNYSLIHRWRPSNFPCAFYTEEDLRTIHRSFGHPSVQSTEGLLKLVTGLTLSREGRDTIDEISHTCTPCRTPAAAPRRFKLTVRTDGIRFNQSVQIDTMFLHSKPVLHMVYMATHFCAACFHRNQSAAAIWTSIHTPWTLVYIGPPDHLTVDQGSSYVSREIRAILEADGVTLQEAAIENLGAIGTVERYHAPLRAAFMKIRDELGLETIYKRCLQMAIFSVNATVGPEGLCPMLPLFGSIPRPA